MTRIYHLEYFMNPEAYPIGDLHLQKVISVLASLTMLIYRMPI